MTAMQKRLSASRAIFVGLVRYRRISPYNTLLRHPQPPRHLYGEHPSKLRKGYFAAEAGILAAVSVSIPSFLNPGDSAPPSLARWGRGVGGWGGKGAIALPSCGPAMRDLSVLVK